MKTLNTILTGMLIFSLVSATLAAPANDNAGGPERIRVLIGFRNAPGPSERALIRSHSGTIRHNYRFVPAIAASIPEPAIAGLMRNPNVVAIEPDVQVYAIDTELDNSWGVKRIGAGIVHDSDNLGTGVKVAIIDTGIDYNHDDLDDNYKGGYDFVNADSDPMDDHGHGTHVAGTVAAEDNETGVVGVAPEAHLYAYKVLAADGYGWLTDVAAAVELARINGIQVANLSLGGTGDPGSWFQAFFDGAEAAGMVIVAAAGNAGNRRGTGDNVIYPAAYASCIAVAATDSIDRRASFSSTGPAVEIAAPGVYIRSTYLNDGYAYMSGTSMASPHVAGTAALIIKSGITGAAVRTKLQDTADYLGDPLWFGFGLVDADEAAGAPVDPGNIPPVADFTCMTDDLTAYFTDISSDSDGSVDSWDWDFGDGYTSTTQDPTHTYGAPGTYLVTLNVTDNEGATDSASKNVTVSEPPSNYPPTANFTFTTSDLTAYFTDTSTDSDGSVDSWDWDFGDGATSTAQNPAHTYAGAGTYTVTLFVMDNEGETDSVSKEVTVTEAGEMTMYVADIEMSIKIAGKNVNAKATVTILAVDGGSPVAGATVYGSWDGATSDSDVGVTDTLGRITLQSDKIKNAVSGLTTFVFTVDDVVKSGWDYDNTVKPSNSIVYE